MTYANPQHIQVIATVVASIRRTALKIRGFQLPLLYCGVDAVCVCTRYISNVGL